MSVIATILGREIELPNPPPEDRPWEFDGNAHLQAVREAVGGERELVWGSMRYGCQGVTAREPMPESMIQEGLRGGYLDEAGGERARQRVEAAPSCGWSHHVLLGVGVEGPPELKEAGYTIPCPFYCGTCPSCGGSLAHVAWKQDQHFDPQPRPDGQAYFIVPDEKTAAENVAQNYQGADYQDPTGRTR